MLDTYRQILSVPGSLRFSASGMVARLPISMVGLAIVLLVEHATGSYGLAGAVSAVYVAAGAVVNIGPPLLDRPASFPLALGQARLHQCIDQRQSVSGKTVSGERIARDVGKDVGQLRIGQIGDLGPKEHVGRTPGRGAPRERPQVGRVPGMWMLGRPTAG